VGAGGPGVATQGDEGLGGQIAGEPLGRVPALFRKSCEG